MAWLNIFDDLAAWVIIENVLTIHEILFRQTHGNY